MEVKMRGHRLRTVIAFAIVCVTVALFLGDAVLAGLDGHLRSAWSGLGTVAFAAVGGLVVVRRPANRVGWLLSAAGLALGLLGSAEEYARRALLVAPGSLPGGQIAAYIMMWLPLLAIGMLVGVLPQVFPDGRPLSPRWRPAVWAGWVYALGGSLANALDDQPIEGLGDVRNPYPVALVRPFLPALLLMSVVCLVIAVAAGLATLVLRWRRARPDRRSAGSRGGGDERQQLKWFLAGLAPLLVPLAVHDAVPAFGEVGFAILLPLLPIALGVAVLRYRLYDLDIVLNRAAVYTILSGLVALVYVGVVGLAEVLAGADRALWTQVLAAVLAAAVLQPLRTRVQWLVDTLFYGERSRPYEALSQLGRLLEHAPEPRTVLPGLVGSVADALRLPYVAIETEEPDGPHVAAEHGRPVGEPDEFPMTYQDEVVGRLLVCARAGDAFNHADRRLLADLARHAGVAVHAVGLTLALQRSRAAMVTAREEERRRLRRDLHDGLGPALAGVTLGLHAAGELVRRDPDRAVAQLQTVQGQVEEAVRDIRRLVYGLRPPALDELGLVRAVQREAARFEGRLAFAFDLPADGLGVLPAAVEAAAYRIACEALTNVARHADAQTCRVRMTRAEGLEVEIHDDGRGMAGPRVDGVGLAAMRERAEELGGTFVVDSPGAGTRVLARLPILEPVG
jgi:signal transduction histidine kinase